MIISGRRKFAVCGVAGIVLASGFGFVQSRGGWAEVVNMPAKLARETPAVQGGFEFLGAARLTPAERGPRLAFGDTLLGGSYGPIGSTRIWFRLPPLKASDRLVPGDEEMTTTVGFSDGAKYRAQWEMADISQRIGTLLIPSGHPPTEWIEVEVKLGAESARWRLTGIPKAHRAVTVEGSDRFEAEGAVLRVRARKASRRTLNTDPKEHTAFVDYEIEGPPVAADGSWVEARIERIIPEYGHPEEIRSAEQRGATVTPGRITRDRAVFPYADRMGVIVVEGEMKVVRSRVETFELPNARVQRDARARRLFQLESDPIRLPDGSSLFLRAPLVLGGSKPNLAVATSQPDGNVSATLVTAEARNFRVQTPDWEEGLAEWLRSSPGKFQFSLGTVKVDVPIRTVVKSIPFRLRVPLGPPDARDTLTAHQLRMTPPSAPRLQRPSLAVSGAAGGN